MHVLLLILFTSLTMVAAAAGNHILLLYKRSILLVSGVTGILPGMRFVALFSMAQSCGAARISTLICSTICTTQAKLGIIQSDLCIKFKVLVDQIIKVKLGVLFPSILMIITRYLIHIFLPRDL